MYDRTLNALSRCLLSILLLLSAGERLCAQCSGPFALTCRGEVELILGSNCQAEVVPEVILDGLPACLADSNFTVLIEDDQPDNGPFADAPGRYRYLITGQNHPALVGFSCTGFVNLTDATPPVIELTPGPIDRSCALRYNADIDLLPPEVAHCYVVSGTDGLPVPGSLDWRLAQALNRGGGIPHVYDACGGDVEVCVNDAFDTPVPGICVDTVTLQRSFTARSIAGNANFAPAFRAQNIRFLRPQIEQLSVAESTNFVDCNPSAPFSLNPLPRPSDYPFLATNTAPIHISLFTCDYFVNYTDGSRISGCGGNYSFTRTYQVIDQCNGGQTAFFTQLVSVGDHEGPIISLPTQDLDFDGAPDSGPLVYSTNTGQCTAVLDLSLGVAATDVCENNAFLEASVFLNENLATTPLGPYRIIGGVTDPITAPLPLGNHLVRYTGSDACGNLTTEDVALRITDNNPPLVVCAEQLTTNLNGNGLSVLPAANLDDGSSDGCSSVVFTTARVDANDLPV
ncbi:MAG: hypothetical protein AAF597_09365, partial [Bacteroidota bacterium]